MKKLPRFETYRSKDGWRWRLRSANGRIICTGEAHSRKTDAERAAKTVAETAAKAQAKELVQKVKVTGSLGANATKELGRMSATLKRMAVH